MEEYISKRTIEDVLDVETGEIISSNDFFKQPESIIIGYRRIQEEAIAGYCKPKYKCPYCLQIIKISGKKTRRGAVSFFAHQYDSDECEIKTDGKYSKEEIEVLKYNGIKESQRHIDLKNRIFEALTTQKSKNKGIENVYVEKRIKSDNPILNWRRPDICAEFQNKKIVFELQLSTTFLSVIVSRDIFYKLNETFIIWVFNFSQNRHFVDLKTLMCKDIYYANKRNAFIFDDEAMKKSIEEEELYLLCIWFEPLIEGNRIKHGSEVLHEMYVKLSDLKFDSENYKPYFIDADYLFTKYEPEFLSKRRKVESDNKMWLEEVEKRFFDKIELKEKEQKQKELDQELKFQKIKKGVDEGVYDLNPKKKKGKWGFESEGVMIIEPIYNSIGPYSNTGLALVRRNRKSGYVDMKGEEKISCIYTKAFHFNNDRAIVKEEGEWLVIDENGDTKSSFPENSKIEFLNEQFLIFRNPSSWSEGMYGYYVDSYNIELVNYEGDILTKGQYSSIEEKKYGSFEEIRNDFSSVKDDQLIIATLTSNDDVTVVLIDKKSLEDNSFSLFKNDKWGLIDQNYTQVLACDYEANILNVETFYKTKYNSHWGTINIKGDIIIPFEYQVLKLEGKKIKVKKNNLWGFLNYTGEEIVPIQFEYIGEFVGSIAKAKKGGLVGIIDYEGNTIISFSYNSVEEFGEDFYIAKVDDLIGLISVGRDSISYCKYKSIKELNYNQLKVNNNGLWGIIDFEAQEVVPCKYDVIEVFDGNYYKVQLKGLWGVIDMNSGEELISCEYEVLTSFYNDRAKVKKNSLWGYIDRTGRVLIPCQYEEIEPFKDKKAKVQKGGKWGYINYSGEVIVNIIYDEIQEFYDGATVIRFRNEKARIYNLARYIFGNNRGYVNQEGREYWQYWRDERDFRKQY